MNHTEFFRHIKQDTPMKCYFFEGEEEFTKRAAIKALRAKAVTGDFPEMNLTRLTDPAPETLIASADTMPFMADRRMVEVRSFTMLTGKPKEYDEDTALSMLSAYLDELPETVCLVFYQTGKADGRKKMTQLLRKIPGYVSFDPLEDGELFKWLLQKCKSAGKEIERSVCQEIVFSVGHDLTLIDNETEKLIAYTGDAGSITKADVDAVCVKSVEYKVFDLADTLLRGQGPEAFRTLRALLQDGEQRVLLISLLGRQCRQVRYAKAITGGPGQISRKLGIPWSAAEQLARTAAMYTFEQLAQMAKWCVDAEYAVKNGDMPENGSMEQIMLKILAIRAV